MPGSSYAAALLGVDASADLSAESESPMDENLDVRRGLRSLLKEAKALGLTLRSSSADASWTRRHWHNNIAYAPGPGLRCNRICEATRRGRSIPIIRSVDAILHGQDTRSVFQYLKDQAMLLIAVSRPRAR